MWMLVDRTCRSFSLLFSLSLCLNIFNYLNFTLKKQNQLIRYRESLSLCVEDLFKLNEDMDGGIRAPAVNLFVLCPNGIRRSGENQDCLVPNPIQTSPEHLNRFEFVGRLMGISLRARICLPFSMPSYVWKLLVNRQSPSLEDYRSVDEAFVDTVNSIRESGLSSEDELTFSAKGSARQEVELLEGGLEINVENNKADVSRYCNLVQQFRLHEFDSQISAIRRGLFSIVTERATQLLTWMELERLICGHVEIDLEILKRHTEYRGYHVKNSTIRYFWKVLESFSHEQRSRFIRFAWGRSRLPRGAQWSHHLTITRLNSRNGENILPVAHTCFFEVELPPYKSEEMMRKRLLTTIQFGLGGMLLQ